MKKSEWKVCLVRLTPQQREKAKKYGTIAEGVRACIDRSPVFDKVTLVNILVELIQVRQHLQILSNVAHLNPELFDREILDIELDGVMGIRKRLEDLIR